MDGFSVFFLSGWCKVYGRSHSVVWTPWDEMIHFNLPLFVRRRSDYCSFTLRTIWTDKKINLISSHSRMSVCRDRIPKDTSVFFNPLLNNPIWRFVSMEQRWTSYWSWKVVLRWIPWMQSTAYVACVLYRLGSVVVCSPPVCVKQLTLAHMPPGGIPSILMRVSAEECYAMAFCVS